MPRVVTLQEIALNSEMSQPLRINLHILAITFANFVSSHSNVPGLFQYIRQVGPADDITMTICSYWEFYQNIEQNVK